MQLYNLSSSVFNAVHLNHFTVMSTKMSGTIIQMLLTCTFSNFQNNWPQRDKPLSIANEETSQFSSIANRESQRNWQPPKRKRKERRKKGKGDVTTLA